MGDQLKDRLVKVKLDGFFYGCINEKITNGLFDG